MNIKKVQFHTEFLLQYKSIYKVRHAHRSVYSAWVNQQIVTNCIYCPHYFCVNEKVYIYIVYIYLCLYIYLIYMFIYIYSVKILGLLCFICRRAAGLFGHMARTFSKVWQNIFPYWDTNNHRIGAYLWYPKYRKILILVVYEIHVSDKFRKLIIFIFNKP